MTNQTFFNYREKPSKKKPWLKYYTKIEELPFDTIYRNLFKNIEKNPDQTVFHYCGRKITAGELMGNILDVASALIVSGVRKGDVVTIALPAIPELTYLFYALNRIGAIANIVDPKSKHEELEHYVNKTQSKMLFMMNSEAVKLKDTLNRKIVTISLSDSYPMIRKYVNKLKSVFTAKEGPKFMKWNSFVAESYHYHKMFETSLFMHESYYRKDQPAIIVHPKEGAKVTISNDEINSLTEDYINAGFEFKPNQQWLNMIPPFLENGVITGIHIPLMAGIEVILVPEVDSNQFDQLLIKHKPNHTIGTISQYQNLLQSKTIQNQNLSFWQSPIVSGGTMKEKLEKDLNQFLKSHQCNAKIKKRYEISNTTSIVTTPSDKCNEIGSVGIPLASCTIGIFDPKTGEEQDYSEIGEICIQAKNLENTQQNAIKKHQDGTTWIHSKDLGYINEDGLLFIEQAVETGIECHNGFLAEPKKIENTILRHVAIKSCMVIGIDDLIHGIGYLPKAYITLKYREPNIEGELKMLCRKLLPEYEQPIEFEIRDQLPLTKEGKHDYRTLQKEALQQQKNSLLAVVKQIGYQKKL